jgi:6-pyruvoyltetrahydropterin/6-carboxytetrahydropterin synthase
MIRLTRRYEFSASHRLHSKQLDETANRQIYGKCNNPFGHGHNYVVEVSVKGRVDPQTGLAVELEALDNLVKRTVIERIDHRNLNEEVSEFGSLVPTTENLAVVIDQRLRSAWPADFPRLEKIRIAETERNIFELNG